MKITAKAIYKQDAYRYGRLHYWESHAIRFTFWLRTAQCTKFYSVRILSRVVLSYYRNKYGIEIPRQTTIGKGLYLGHAWNITINPEAIIGSNCNIHKGVTIGKENRGPRKGAPIIGNFVWIGVNSTIVGNITIGDDVLISPNCYINCNIPSHSIVFGNPCIVKSTQNATEGYIKKTV